jgi:hypothetical protein
MRSGRSDFFSETAKSYIFQVAAERAMNPNIVNNDEFFSEYLQQVNTESKAMRFGTEQEVNARELYEYVTGRRIVEVASCKHPSIPNFASSPDGFFYDEETGERGCIEIKCPSQNTFMKYKSEVRDSASLLATEYKYFYQCQAHMMCLGANWCDFVVYNPFQITPIHRVRISPDEKVFAEMEKRIIAANDLINRIINC